MKNSKTFKMVLTGLFAAMLCVIGPISIPLNIIPITFTLFIIFLSSFILDKKMCTLSTVIYILLGAVGLPVFSGFAGGLAKLAGPTGGYIIGFIFTAFICAFFNEKFRGKIVLNIIGMIIGLAVLYFFGTVWFAYQQKTGFIPALTICVLPYLVGDAIKIVLSAIAGPIIRKRLEKAELV